MSIWVKDITVDDVNKRSKDTLANLLGIEFTHITDETMTATMPVDSRTKQPAGILHGGASCVLAETVGSTASNSAVDNDIKYCVGLEINANHIRPMTEGLVTATTYPIHIGNKTHVWHIDIKNEKDKLVCVSRLTMAVIER